MPLLDEEVKYTIKFSYFSMTIDFTTIGKVMFTMFGYIEKNLLTELTDDLSSKGEFVTLVLAGDHLFQEVNREDPESLDGGKGGVVFHMNTEKEEAALPHNKEGKA